MEKLKFNPGNKKYYSEEFIKGFECGVERQFNADKEQKIGRWISLDDFRGKYNENGFMCSECGEHIDFEENYCPNCGSRMKGGDTE